MNRDDIIRMALEAADKDTVDPFRNGYWTLTQQELERFAAIVSDRMIRNGYRKCAQGQRATQFCGQLEAAVAGAVAAEREACAKVCDPEPSLPNETYAVHNTKASMRRCAAAIRARGPQ